MIVGNKLRTQKLLKGMLVISWIIFVGLAIETGALLITYGMSWFNPEVAKNLYRGLDLFDLRQHSFWTYTQSISFLVAMKASKTYIAYLAIKILSKVNMEQPFRIEVVNILERMSYFLVGLWVIAVFHNEHIQSLPINVELLSPFKSGEFILVAGLVYLISQVFKRGVEIQMENDLTI